MVPDLFEGVVFFTSYAESHSYDLRFPGSQSIKDPQYLLRDIFFSVSEYGEGLFFIADKVLEF